MDVARVAIPDGLGVTIAGTTTGDAIAGGVIGSATHVGPYETIVGEITTGVGMIAVGGIAEIEIVIDLCAERKSGIGGDSLSQLRDMNPSSK